MTAKECEKCKKLNEKLGTEEGNKYEYVAICNECHDKRLSQYQKEIKDNY